MRVRDPDECGRRLVNIGRVSECRAKGGPIERAVFLPRDRSNGRPDHDGVTNRLAAHQVLMVSDELVQLGHRARGLPPVRRRDKVRP